MSDREMTFCTAINCMDGRVQTPVIDYLQRKFGAEYVDCITEPGPNLILAGQTDEALVKSVMKRVAISVEKHASKGIAIAGHYDCAGNPGSEDQQAGHTIAAVEFLRGRYPDVPVIGLWVDENWRVSVVRGREDI